MVTLVATGRILYPVAAEPLPPSLSGRALTSGELARAVGVGVETLRYYERRTLLPKPPRNRAGYRQYPPSAVTRVAFIRRAQELGFTLREINELLHLRLDSTTTCSEVEDRVAEKVNEIDTKMDDLGEIRDALERLAERCRTSPPTSHCPFLEELSKQSSRSI